MINIFSNEEAAAEPGLNILRQSVGLSKFLGNCVLTKLNQVTYFFFSVINMLGLHTFNEMMI